MGGASSRNEDLAADPAHSFLISQHCHSSMPIEREEGKLMRIAGNGAKTIVELYLNTSSRGWSGDSKNWFTELTSQRDFDRTIEVRITITLVDAKREPNGRDLMRDTRGSGFKWPRIAYFDAALEPTNSWENMPCTFRCEKELSGLPLNVPVTLLIKPEFTQFFLQPVIRITFLGDDSWGDSFIRIKASPWERLTLPQNFDPRLDPQHLCQTDDGIRLCQPVNLLSEAGVGGRHFEWYPLDGQGGEAVARTLSRRWHETLVQARRGQDEALLQRTMPLPSPAFSEQQKHMYDKPWDAEDADAVSPPAAQIMPASPAFSTFPPAAPFSSSNNAANPLAQLKISTNSLQIIDSSRVHTARDDEPDATAVVVQKPSAKDFDDEYDDPFLAHSNPEPAVVSRSPNKFQSNEDLHLVRGQKRFPAMISGRNPAAMLPRLVRDEKDLEEEVLDEKQPDNTSDSPRIKGPRARTDLTVMVPPTPPVKNVSTPMMFKPDPAAPPASNLPLSRLNSKNNKVLPATVPESSPMVGGLYDPFSEMYAPEVDHLKGVHHNQPSPHPFAMYPNNTNINNAPMSLAPPPIIPTPNYLVPPPAQTVFSQSAREPYEGVFFPPGAGLPPPPMSAMSLPPRTPAAYPASSFYARTPLATATLPLSRSRYY